MKRDISPTDFDAACRVITRRVPGLSETSGKRSVTRNEAVGGSPHSKHLIGMARDFVGSEEDIQSGAEIVRALGLFFRIHDAGTGNHLHVQGLPPGDINESWLLQYSNEEV